MLGLGIMSGAKTRAVGSIVTSSLKLANDSSFLLLADGSSFLKLANS